MHLDCKRPLVSFLLLSSLTVSAAVIPIVHGPESAFAQSAPRVTTTVSEPHPQVGAPFLLELVVSGSEPFHSVSSAELRVPPGFSLSGPSQSTRTEMHLVNGVSSTTSSVVIAWVLTASQPGNFTISAPTVNIDGSPISGKPTTLEIVPSTGAPPSGTPGFPSPFMTPSPSSPFDLDDTPDDSPQASTDALALPKAPDDQLFLHAVADRTEAYLGQQVTLSFYVYYRTDFEMTERKEAPLVDFLRVSLLTDPSSTTAQYTRVEGKRFGARLVDRIAVFPLKSGKLSTGTISARFKGRRIGAGVLRTSNELTIDVIEPPKDGRPPAYVLGDVGHFAVSAVVQPRQALQGSSVSVTVKVDGIGNVPSSIHMPRQKGVEWLEPERKDGLTTKEGKVGGARTFGYVAILKNSGKIDLGDIELPYFNPETKAYETAKTKIGVVDVIPTDPKADDIARAKAGTDEDILAKLPKSRAQLSPYAPVPDEHLPTWGLAGIIAAPPLLVVLGLGLGLVGGGLRRRRSESRGSARTLVKEALDEAKRAEKASDVKAVASNVERAIHAAVEACTGLASRGVVRTSLVSDLEKRDVPTALAEEILAVLSVSEDLRYSPTTDTTKTEGLIDRARELVKRLERVDRQSRPKEEER